MDNNNNNNKRPYFDNLFGPKHSSSSSTTAIFGSIFPPTSPGSSGKQHLGNQAGGATARYGTQDHFTHNCKSGKGIYQNEKAEPSYLSSSIYYGGQENYSPITSSTQSHHILRKNEGDNDPNGESWGNWWQGSLYY